MTAEWQAAGLCLIPAYRPLYADQRPDGVSLKKQIADAKATCRRCPSVGTCLQWALEQEGTAGASGRSGVLGGLSARERAALAGAPVDDGDEDGAQ